MALIWRMAKVAATAVWHKVPIAAGTRMWTAPLVAGTLKRILSASS